MTAKYHQARVLSKPLTFQKVKVELSLCLIKHKATKTYEGVEV
jgi:hypothetical protein